jgi:hypothetical protein
MKLELRIRLLEAGGWDVDLWRGGKMVKRYSGSPTLHEAVDRGVAWLRDARGQR